MAKRKVRARRFKKGKVSRNAAKQSRGSQYGYLNLPKSVSVFKEEPASRVQLDIMPYVVTDPAHPDRDEEWEIAVPDSLWYKRPYWLHRNIGPNNDVMVCPRSAGNVCPICAHRDELLRKGADWDDDTVRALKPSMRNLYVVIPRRHKNYAEEPHIWDISQYLFQDKLNEEIQEDEEYETFPDLEEGLTLRIRFSEESIGSNKFAETSRIDFKERKKPYPESILDDIPNLNEILDIPSAKAAEALFFGGLTQDELEDMEEQEDPLQDDDGWDEDGWDEEEIDDGWDEEPEPEPEPEPKPKPKRRRKPKRQKAQDECPHGHEFGTDCDEYDECDECDDWEACIDASEEI